MEYLQHNGRIKIFTDEPVITYENVIEVLQNAFPSHTTNQADIKFLLDFDAGIQPMDREKVYRPDINCECIDNVAHQVVEFKLGFNWGNPITLVQRGEKDSGDTGEALGVALLNECYDSEGNTSKTQQLARFIEIDGIGFTYVGVKNEDDWEDGESYFSVSVLEPQTTFVIYSSYYIDQRPMLGVTYRHDKKTGNNYFTCFSKDRRYEIINMMEIINGEPTGKETWSHRQRSGEPNQLHKIPVIEWIRSHDRTGCFEHQISEMLNLNLMLSDFSNDVEQNMNCIWHANDVEFPLDEDGNEKKPKNGEWAMTETTPDGRTPFINPLVADYNYDGMLTNTSIARARILEKCDVPSRADTSGGSTGLAIDTATGYTMAETAAAKEQSIIETCKMEEVAVVLSALKESLVIEPDNEMLKLRKKDIRPSIKRQKNYELTTKVNFFATAVSHGINGLHALKAMDAFEDINQVWEDSKDTIEAYQKSIFDKKNSAVGGEGESKADSGKTLQDVSDQISNSPLIESMTTETQTQEVSVNGGNG